MKKLTLSHDDYVNILNVDKKRARFIDSADLHNVLKAKKQGNVRVFTSHSHKTVFITAEAWQDFMSKNNDEELRNISEIRRIDKQIADHTVESCKAN